MSYSQWEVGGVLLRSCRAPEFFAAKYNTKMYYEGKSVIYHKLILSQLQKSFFFILAVISLISRAMFCVWFMSFMCFVMFWARVLLLQQCCIVGEY